MQLAADECSLEERLVIFLRHGESNSNITHVDELDTPLTKKGIMQALDRNKVVISKLSFDHVFISPLQRAMQTFYHAFGQQYFERKKEQREAEISDTESSSCSSTEVKCSDPVMVLTPYARETFYWMKQCRGEYDVETKKWKPPTDIYNKVISLGAKQGKKQESGWNPYEEDQIAKRGGREDMIQLQKRGTINILNLLKEIYSIEDGAMALTVTHWGVIDRITTAAGKTSSLHSLYKH